MDVGRILLVAGFFVAAASAGAAAQVQEANLPCNGVCQTWMGLGKPEAAPSGAEPPGVPQAQQPASPAAPSGIAPARTDRPVARSKTKLSARPVRLRGASASAPRTKRPRIATTLAPAVPPSKIPGLAPALAPRPSPPAARGAAAKPDADVPVAPLD